MASLDKKLFCGLLWGDAKKVAIDDMKVDEGEDEGGSRRISLVRRRCRISSERCREIHRKVDRQNKGRRGPLGGY